MTITTLAVTPQPIGIFPLPAGYLILPSVEGVETVLPALMQGQAPDNLPDSLEFFRLALDGELDAAYQAIAADGSLEAAYNRFVLKSSPESYARLARVFKGELRQLLDVVAYTIGYLAMPPRRGEAQCERLAMILMAQATDALERDDADRAIELLAEAAELTRPISPLFAAQIISTLAQTKYAQFGAAPALVQHYQDALKLLEPAGPAHIRAEMWLNLGIVYHDLASGRRGALLEAVKCYQQALSVLTRDKYPEAYALAQSNLGLAYLAMPLQEAGDQLRMAIAVQSLREALKVYTPETYPEQWASAQLNLANAYQYLPSTHPEENLIQAVELYEELLAVRRHSSDPVGYARVLANQGNALAHLGIFAQAVPKLQEARSIFEAQGETDAAASITNMLDQINFNMSNGNGHGVV
ncbi:MAG: tetratricopeptide repeat protein [Anaerolineaceae bacterium]|nr:tetratricopeptide repeat protein [Anaerolineaceae bacterium]